MKLRSALYFVTFILMVSALGACTLPTFGTTGYTAKVSPPHSGAVYGLGDDIGLRGTIDYGISQPAVTGLVFWGNGQRIPGGVGPLDTTVSSSGSNTEYSGVQYWTPSAPGEYQIQVQGTISNGRTVISAPVRICVLDFALPRLDGVNDGGSSGYTGPCPLPPAPAFSPGTNIVTIAGTATPSSLVFSNLTDPVCRPPAAPMVTFHASANDLGSRIALVTAVYTAAVPGVGGGTDSIVLNADAGAIPPTRTFTGTTPNLEGILANLQDGSGNAISGDLVWYLHAYGRDGSLLVTAGPYTIPAAPCSGIPTVAPHVIQPFPTDTPTPGDLIAKVEAFPIPVYYGESCPNLANLSFRAALKLPDGSSPDQIQVMAHVSVDGPGGSSAGNLLIPMANTNTWDAASGGQIFLGSISLTHSYHDANNTFDLASLGSSPGALKWFVSVSSGDKELAKSTEQSINLAPCPKYAKPTSQPSSNSCSLSQPACSLKGLKFDPSTCSCVP